MDEIGEQEQQAYRSHQPRTALRRSPNQGRKGQSELRARQRIDDECPSAAPALDIPADLFAEVFLPDDEPLAKGGVSPEDDDGEEDGRERGKRSAEGLPRSTFGRIQND